MNAISSLPKYFCLGIAAALFSAAPALADPAGNWGGTYLGGFAGGSMSNFDHNAGSDSSLLYGGDVGHNWQRDHMIIGLEGDFSKYNAHVGNGGAKYTEDWMSTARARLGYGIDRFMPYVTGGLALTDGTMKVSGAGSEERIEPGPALGGGLDTKITDQWFARVEYLYTGVPEANSTLGGRTISGGSENHALRIGLNYKFQ